MEIKEYHVSEEKAGVRLDAYCAEQEPDFSRGYIKNLLNEGAVKVDGGQKKASYKLKGKEIITMEIPEPAESTIEPENIPLEIIYEDEDVILINKPKGNGGASGPGQPVRHAGQCPDAPYRCAVKHQRCLQAGDHSPDR